MRIAILAAAATAVLAAAPAALAAESLSPTALTERSIELRGDWGLSTDRSLIERLVADNAAVERGLQRYGIPLTSAEEARLVQRGRVASAARRVASGA